MNEVRAREPRKDPPTFRKPNAGCSTDMYHLLEALEASDPAKRELLSKAIDGYAEDCSDDVFWAISAHRPPSRQAVSPRRRSCSPASCCAWPRSTNDAAMRDAGERLVKAAKRRPGRSD